jgi:putative acetyltransferase
MIRKLADNDIDKVMDIWLDINIKAHDFIPASYWFRNYDSVKKMLPDAAIFVYEESNQIQGFIGLTGNYIAGIFIHSNSQSKGIGKELLNYVKKDNPKLLLRVYRKNVRAVNFYLREDFVVIKEQMDENTDEIELVMSWAK